MHQFKDLKVWQDAIDLAVDIYRLTRTLPSEEKFGLISQMNRSVISISSNIAEGSGRNNPKEFRHFLGIALASACELESQLIVSQKLEFINEEILNIHTKQVAFIQNRLAKLIATLS